MRPGRGGRAVVGTLAACLACARALAAQATPPPPLPLDRVELPRFQERKLASGAQLIVVPQHEVPFVTVNLVLPGGSVVDPPGAEGVASFTAQLLTRGTSTRSKDELADAVDFLGATLSASASDDWSTVSLGVVTPELDRGLGLMADAVLHPSFPADELALLRTRTLSALQVQLSQPDALASRAFTRTVYGDHPYGRLVTPTSVQAVDRAAVETYHEAWYRPTEALFVVAGDVEVEDVARRIDGAFAGWEAAPLPERHYPEPPGRVQPRVVVVHRPGAVQSEVRVGELLPAGRLPDWTALSVANQILGGGPSGRLFRVLREERGYTYGASSSVTRRRDRGVFTASMAVRTEVTGQAVGAMLQLIQELGTDSVPVSELRDTKDFLVGSFPLQIETPQQVAAQLTSGRLLGLPDDALETYRDRVEALDGAAVRRAAARYLDPQQLLVVVAGDATRVRDQLATLGHVQVVDAEGAPLTLADLTPQRRSEVLDASSLEPISLTYNVVIQGNLVGTAERTLTRPEPGQLRYASQVKAGPQSVSQDVVVSDALQLISSRNEISVQGQTLSISAHREGEHLTGTVSLPGQGEQPLSMDVPADVVVSDMVELALWVADLEVGKRIRLPMAVLQSQSLENVTLEVKERTQVTVPAGTFDVFRVEMSGAEAQTFWVRAQAPHRVVRIEATGQPVALELAEVGGG